MSPGLELSEPLSFCTCWKDTKQHELLKGGCEPQSLQRDWKSSSESGSHFARNEEDQKQKPRHQKGTSLGFRDKEDCPWGP